MATAITIIFVALFIGGTIELALPIIELIRLKRARRPWKKIQEVIDFPPKPGEEISVDAPSYKFGEYIVPCRFTVSRDAEHPILRNYRLDVGDLESFEFTDLSVNGSIVQYLRDKVYAGNWVF